MITSTVNKSYLPCSVITKHGQQWPELSRLRDGPPRLKPITTVFKRRYRGEGLGRSPKHRSRTLNCKASAIAVLKPVRLIQPFAWNQDATLGCVIFAFRAVRVPFPNTAVITLAMLCFFMSFA